VLDRSGLEVRIEALGFRSSGGCAYGARGKAADKEAREQETVRRAG
jgi:hypothetical protein